MGAETAEGEAFALGQELRRRVSYASRRCDGVVCGHAPRFARQLRARLRRSRPRLPRRPTSVHPDYYRDRNAIGSHWGKPQDPCVRRTPDRLRGDRTRASGCSWACCGPATTRRPCEPASSARFLASSGQGRSRRYPQRDVRLGGGNAWIRWAARCNRQCRPYLP